MAFVAVFEAGRMSANGKTIDPESCKQTRLKPPISIPKQATSSLPETCVPHAEAKWMKIESPTSRCVAWGDDAQLQRPENVVRLFLPFQLSGLGKVPGSTVFGV